MNKEIKFRGKSLNTKRWVYGDLRQDPIRRKAYVEYEVDPSTIGQYTGLKDKNGTEIYEGDIVSVSVKSRNTVEVYAIAYDKERACFGLEKEYCGEKYISAFASWEPNKDLFPYMLVIGNVYENTELIN